jgi:4-amino-4-deoxy-L-arabinose transferase-like glycosyltransferase/sugar lactone lactonase YvrE
MFTTPIPSIYAWLFHLSSIALLILSVVWVDGRIQKGEEKNPSWSWIEIGLLLLIFGIAAFMRLYRFDQIPFGTWYDEADNGLDALRILNESGYLPVFSTTLPAHLLYLIALSFKIFGVTTYAIRAVSVAFGLATVAVAYLTGRELFNRRMGLVLAFFLAVSRWDVNWSRIGMHGITVPFFELLTIFLTLRALRRQRLRDYTLVGLSLGFGLCFYTPLRLFPLVLVLFLMVLWLSHHDLIRSSWRGILFLILGAFIAAVPVISFAVSQPDTFWNRMQDVSIFNGKTAQEGLAAVVQTTRDHLLMFNYQGDKNGRHNLPGEPMLDPISGALLVLGIGLSLWRIRQPGSFLLIAWLLIMLAPGIFSLDFESPQSLRVIGSLPAAYLLAVVPIHALWQEWEKINPFTQSSETKLFKRRAAIFTLPLIFGLAVMGYYNYHIYFDRQAISFDSWNSFSTPETIIGNIMKKLGNQVNYYVSAFYYHVPTVQFLAPEVTSYQRIETQETLPLPLDAKKGVVMFVDADRKPFFQQAEQYYPNASFQEFKGPQGQTVLYEIYLKPADIAATQGLVANYYHSTDWYEKSFLVRNESNFDFDWRNGNPAPFPFGVEWSGILFVPEYGSYSLIVRSPNPTIIYIDEVQVALTGNSEQTGEIELAKGNHTIKIRAIAQDGHFELLWIPPSREQVPIPLSSLLLPPITNNGLLGRYYANGNWQNPPAFTQIDPWIHFYFHNPPLPRPYTVEWTGKINIAKGGQYHFGLESIDESSLFIDEKQIINDQTPNQYMENEVDLSPGFHLIRLRFADRTGSTHINLYWTPLGSAQEVIPMDVLFPPQAIEEANNPNNPVSENPAKTTGPTTNPTNPQSIPIINAKLLWQTGGCGSGEGQFQSPHGLAVDQQGNIWVADTGNRRIVEINADGKYLMNFGQTGEKAGQFLQPYDLVVEQGGNLVILDSESPNVLQRFTHTGVFQTSFGSSLSTYSPRGLGIDHAGNLFIADTGGSRLLKISRNGDLLSQWRNNTGKIDLYQLVSVAINSDGVIYIIDPNGWIWELRANGNFENWPATAPADTATGPHISISSKSSIYITDPENQRVVIFTSDGHPIGQLRSPEDNPALFSKPVGVAIGPDDTLYISDSTSCHILAFRLPKP